MTTFLSMADAIIPTDMPAGQDVYAGYTGGQWHTYPELPALFPGKRYFGFSIAAYDWGDALDIEQKDASIPQAPGWARNVWKPVNVTKPVLYINAANIQALVDTMTLGGWARTDYYVLSAHYWGPLHVCAPSSCGQTGGTAVADGTQWYSGNGYDLTTVPDYFFTPTEEDPLTADDLTSISTLIDQRLAVFFAGPGKDRVVQGVLQAISEDGTALQGAVTAALNAQPAQTVTVTAPDVETAVNAAIDAHLAAILKALTTT